MGGFLSRLKQLQGKNSTAAFARILGINQKTLDHLVKGERKPSVEVVIAICSKLDVSADWLLGLPERGKSGDGAADALKVAALKGAIQAILDKF